MLYIEREIASTFSLDSIIDDFEDLKEHQIPFFIDNILRNNSVLCLLSLFVNDCVLIYKETLICVFVLVDSFVNTIWMLI